MQTLSWYYRRLRAMSPREVIWRIKCSLRDATDRAFLNRRQRLLGLGDLLAFGGANASPRFRVSDITVGQWAGEQAGQTERRWLEKLEARADRIAAHRLRLFDLEDCHLGDPIDWNRDHKLNKTTPMTFAPSIDYRDTNVAGDCKFVWEPSRHHQLVVLGRAYRAGGDERYAKAVVEQLDSWLVQCQFGLGMQWRSPLELGIRLINWVWAVDLIAESHLVVGQFRHRLLNAVYRQMWEVARKLSGGSSANNHVIGEAAGVFVATSYFRNMKNAWRWHLLARRRLCEEVLAQTCQDGGDREQAVSYHLFVLQFALIAALVGRWAGEEFPVEYWNRLEEMFAFADALSEGGEQLPMIGDGDDGYVLDLGEDPRKVAPWLAVGAVLFDRAQFKTWAGEFAEPARWLAGQTARQRFDALNDSPDARDIASRALKDSGYYLLQNGRGQERISVVFDCGELGLGSLAGHGHADALSLSLRAYGKDVLVDPGTYDYFSYPRWRDYFRSTRAHNTVVIDGLDQSVMLGPFLWGRRARARCLCWEPTETGGKVVGEHDGYARLAETVIHRRTCELDGQARSLVVRDVIVGTGSHDVAVYFHFAEDCRVQQVGPGRFRIDVAPGVVTMTMDAQLGTEILTGSEDPIAGWVSRGYHRKAPSTTIIGRCRSEGDTTLTCQFAISLPNKE